MWVLVHLYIVQDAYRVRPLATRSGVHPTMDAEKEYVTTFFACSVRRPAATHACHPNTHTHRSLSESASGGGGRPWTTLAINANFQPRRPVTLGTENGRSRSMQGNFGKSKPNPYHTKEGYNVFLFSSPTTMCFDKEIFLDGSPGV